MTPDDLSFDELKAHVVQTSGLEAVEQVQRNAAAWRAKMAADLEAKHGPLKAILISTLGNQYSAKIMALGPDTSTDVAKYIYENVCNAAESYKLLTAAAEANGKTPE